MCRTGPPGTRPAEAGQEWGRARVPTGWGAQRVAPAAPRPHRVIPRQSLLFPCRGGGGVVGWVVRVPG